MPLTFTIAPVSALTDGGPGSFLANGNGEAKSGSALLGETLSVDTTTMVRTTIDQDELLDSGSILSEPITIDAGTGDGPVTYNPPALVEADYSVVAQDTSTGLYYRITRITIENDEVGVVVSRAFDADLDHFVGGMDGIYPSGRELTIINPDDVFDTPNWEDFVVDEDYNNGPGQQADRVYSNDVVLRQENGVTVICFARGAKLAVDYGEIAVEDLRVGDLVRTLDHGLQPIRWIGSRRVKGEGRLAPILIKKGALGNDRDLRVSPQHRMLLEGWRTELMFGEGQVLVAATHLVNDSTILRDVCDEVEYFHILFDRHEIVFANGAPSESFMPGPEGMDGLADAAREEILILFPELDRDFSSYGPAARVNLKAYEARMLS